jgi:acetate kinase
MNVLVLNAGSSNLKFQLIASDLGRITRNGDERLCRGRIERIGGEAIIAVHVRNSLKQTFTASLSDISGALEYLVRWIASDESGITEVRSPSDIHAVGHRVVHGGELLTESTVITERGIRGDRGMHRFGSPAQPNNIKGMGRIEAGS